MTHIHKPLLLHLHNATMTLNDADLVGHSYGVSTIEGNARVQLGDVNSYSYHYSTSDAQDAIYRNTLTVTLRELLYHKSLYGSFVRVPTSAIFAQPLRESIDGKLKTLENYLGRVQEIEQTRILRSGENKHVFDHAIADPKVANYIRMAQQIHTRLSKHAKSHCSNKGSVSCLDDFCDLVERLSRQIAARVSLDKAFDQLQNQDVPQKTRQEQRDAQETSEQPSTGSAPQSAPSRLNSVAGWEQEYLYATQDFWRQLTSTLQDMANMQRRCWRKSSKFFGAVLLAWFLLFFLFKHFLWRNAPKEAEFVVYLFPTFLTVSVTVVTLLNRRARYKWFRNGSNGMITLSA